EKDLRRKYSELLFAKQNEQKFPDQKDYMKNREKIEMRYYDAVLKSNFPRNQLKAIEKEVKDKILEQQNNKQKPVIERFKQAIFEKYGDDVFLVGVEEDFKRYPEVEEYMYIAEDYEYLTKYEFDIYADFARDRREIESDPFSTDGEKEEMLEKSIKSENQIELRIKEYEKSMEKLLETDLQMINRNFNKTEKRKQVYKGQDMER
ncbi:hypothetical protein, partial [Halomonas sp. PAR8]|uniref:hypothetical protein n=1 Tax=Halomonas sp. PAR8 TaxID=3075515 RepID=UPI002886560A